MNHRTARFDVQTQANILFLRILPALRGYIRKQLPHLPIQHQEEAFAEAAALALISCHSLVRRRRGHLITTPGFSRYIFKAVRGGRHAASSQAGVDVMSTLGRQRHGKRLISLDTPRPRTRPGKVGTDEVPEYVADVIADRKTPVPDQAAFRIDFAIWLKQFKHRDRRMIRLLASGEQAQKIARMLKVSPARISQCRTQWRKSWEQYMGQAMSQPMSQAA